MEAILRNYPVDLRSMGTYFISVQKLELDL